MNPRLVARPFLTDFGDTYNIQVEKDGELLKLGRSLGNGFFEYLEFYTQDQAIAYIQGDPRLILDDFYC